MIITIYAHVGNMKKSQLQVESILDCAGFHITFKDIERPFPHDTNNKRRNMRRVVLEAVRR